MRAHSVIPRARSACHARTFGHHARTFGSILTLFTRSFATLRIFPDLPGSFRNGKI